jgi:hypothetical protein
LLEAFNALVSFLNGNNSYYYSKYGFTFSQDHMEGEITVAIGL